MGGGTRPPPRPPPIDARVRASFHYNNDVIVVYSLDTQGGQITKGFGDKYYTDPLDPPVNLVIEGFIFDTRSFHYWLALDIVLFLWKGVKEIHVNLPSASDNGIPI